MSTPFPKFADWLAEAGRSEISDANACALATVETTANGVRPDVRIVLMKDWSEAGFIFYSNFESAKGRQLASNPIAALDFHWKSLKRQVRMAGAVSRVDDAVADAYFATRPRESQLSAWASKQSRPMENRALFERQLAETGERFPATVTRPPFWSGWLLRPDWIEFWEERPGRQHHRERFVASGNDWERQFLYP